VTHELADRDRQYERALGLLHDGSTRPRAVRDAQRLIAPGGGDQVMPGGGINTEERDEGAFPLPQRVPATKSEPALDGADEQAAAVVEDETDDAQHD